MVTGLNQNSARAYSKTHRCKECGSGLLAPYLGNGEYGVRCLQNETHQGITKRRDIKRLADGQEYDVTTQKPVTDLAIPQNKQEMLARVQEANAIGMWPGKATQGQMEVLAQVALAYGLDPFMGEIIPYQGRPYITIAGRRRKDEEAGHFFRSMSFRPLTQEEKDWYREGGALNEGDLCGYCVMTSTDGRTVEGFGKVSKRQRDSGSQPVAKDNPIEMLNKRAERRARETLWGPIALPRGLDPRFRPLEEGDTVEGEARWVEETPPVESPPAEEKPAPRQSRPKLGKCPEHDASWAPCAAEGGRIGHPVEDGGWHWKDEADDPPAENGEGQESLL